MPGTMIMNDMPTQAIAELVAALDIGNALLGSFSVQAVRTRIVQSLDTDTTHYLFLRTTDDLTSFFGCGTARGGAEVIAEDRAICTLIPVPQPKCPSCNEHLRELHPMAWLPWSFTRLIRCRACGELVPDTRFCIECGHALKED